MEGFPENWLSLKPINISEVGGGEEEEDDGNAILELRLGSNSSDDQDSPKPFDHRRPMNRSCETAVNENRSCRSFRSEEETKCPVCSRCFRTMKAMHGHMRCHPERGWRGVNPPPPPPPPPLRPPSSAMSASSPPPTWGERKGKRCQKGSISDSSKKLKMDEGASSGSSQEENYDSWKEFLSLGLNYGEEESEMKRKEKKQGEASSSSSSTSFEEEKEKEKEKEESHKCKICKKSFLTGQALGGHQTTHRRKSPQLVLPEAQYCKTMTS